PHCNLPSEKLRSRSLTDRSAVCGSIYKLCSLCFAAQGFAGPGGEASHLYRTTLPAVVLAAVSVRLLGFRFRLVSFLLLCFQVAFHTLVGIRRWHFASLSFGIGGGR